MTSGPPACPFCNTALPSVPAPPPTAHLPCPRCGEPVAAGRYPIDADSGETAQRGTFAAGFPPAADYPANPKAGEFPPSARNRAGRSSTARTVLAIMAGMAVIALVFALLTQKIRRDRDPQLPVAAPEHLAPPTKLLGLGFLPRGTNVVAGLHVAALGEDPAGQALLRAPRPELVDVMLATLSTVGLAVEDVDHVVIGCTLKDSLPELTTVIVTRQPYDPAQLDQAVKRRPVNPTTFRDKPLYRFTDQRQVPKLWCAAPRVLVYTTLTREAMDRIPRAGEEPADPLTPVTRNALADRIRPQSRVWIVGDLEPAKGMADVLQLFGVVTKDQARLLHLVRVVTIGLTTQKGENVTVLADLHTGDAAATQELKKLLESFTVPGAKSLKTEAPPADIVAAEAQWVTWQLRTDADALRAALGKLRLMPGKDKAGAP